MSDIRLLSLVVFAVSFVFGFVIFEAEKTEVRKGEGELQLTMTPLFSKKSQ